MPDVEFDTRLEGSDPSYQLLTPKARRFAQAQAKRRRKLERVALARGVDITGGPDPGRFANFFEFLRQLDRPRNAAHNAILGAMKGESPDEVLINLKQGWTFEEMAHFEDMLDVMGAPAGVMRKVGGFVGDVVLDPLNLIPGAAIAKAAKATKVAGLMDRTIKAAGRSAALRQSVVRWTGVPELDEVFQKSIDFKNWTQHVELMETARPIALSLRGLNREMKRSQGTMFEGLLPRLGEETDLNRVREFATRVREGNLQNASIDEINEIITSSRQFRNPSAVREILSVRDPDLQRRWIDLAEEFQGWNGRIRQLREAQGQVVPSFADNLEGLLQQIDTGMADKMRATRRLASRIRKTELRGARQSLRVARQALQRAGISGDDLEKGLESARKRVEELNVDPFEHPEEAFAALDEMATDLEPEMLTRLKDVIQKDFAKSSAAVRYYDQSILRNMVGMLREGKAGQNIREMIDDQAAIEEAITELPRWIHHIATPEAEGLLLDAFKRRRGFRASFADPTTPDILHRKFVRKIELNHRYGREATVPLSFDEIEQAIREAGLPSKFAKRGKEIRGADVDAALRRRRIPSQVIRNEAPKIARFFSVDESQILATATQQTAKSVTSSKYLNEAARIFGKRIDDVGEEAFARLHSLDELPNMKNINQLMPGLRGVRFERDVLEEIGRRWDVLANPTSFIRFLDSLQNYWKSYTLFLYPWYFTRNAIGDHLNMWAGGFGDRPTDMMHMVKATQMQMASMKHNSAAVRRVPVHLRHLDQTINGDEAIDLAIRNGVLNSGWMGGHLNEDLASMIEPAQLGIRSFLPVGNQFLPLRWGKKLGEFTENTRRLAYFIHRLERGDDVRRAAAEVKKRLGDYRSEIMTPLEREFGVRIFPFMRWQRFNIPLNIEHMMMAGSRAKIMAVLRGAQALAPEDEGGVQLDPSDLPEYIPSWIQASAGIPLRRNPDTGEIDFWLTKGWHPAAELDNVLSFRSFGQMAVNQLTPFVKAPIETVTGVSLFKGDRIPDEVEFLGRQMDGRTVNLLRNLRFLNELDKNDPIGMFRVLRSGTEGKTGLDRLRDAGVEFAQATAFGARPFTILPAREQLRFDLDRIEFLSRRISRARRLLEREESR